MKLKRSVLFLMLSLLLVPAAFARKPAVEDFVGVESESYARTPQGTEILFDFGNTVQAFEPQTASFWSEWTPTIVLIGFALLPFAMWFGITRAASKQAEATAKTANVANLADYRNDSKPEGKATDEEEDFKQAS